MMGVIRNAKRGVQVKQVSYDPNLFKKLIIYGCEAWHIHPVEKDDSDHIEEEKEQEKEMDFQKVPNKWGGTTISKIVG